MDRDVLFFVITLIISILIGVFPIARGLLSENPERRKSFAKYLTNNTIEESYYSSLNYCLDVIQRFYSSPFSMRALDRCIIIGTSYSFLFFVIAWVFGYNGKIFDIHVFPIQESTDRLLGFFSIAFCLGVSVLLWRKINNKEDGIKKNFLILIGAFLVSTFSVIATIIFGGAPKTAAFPIGVSIGLAAFIFAGVISSRITISGFAIVALGCSSLIISLFTSFFGGSNIAIAAFLGIFGFGTLLSLLNGFFDWISWAISRKLANSLRGKHSVLRFFTHIVIFDTFFAITLLVLVPAALSGGLQATNIFLSYFDVGLTYNYAPILGAAAQNPFGAEGLWFTLMILTNLVPTVFHLSFAVSTYPMVIFPGSKKRDIAERVIKEDYTMAIVLLIISFIFGVLVVIGVGYCFYLLLGFFDFRLISEMYRFACDISAAWGAACIH